MHPAFEVFRSGDGTSDVVFTCEHASDHLPRPWGDDAWLRPTHWAVDLGIAPFTRELIERLGSRGVFAGFSRLLIDANRPLYSRTLFRDEAEGRPVHLNHELDDEERLARILGWWQPFHDAADAMLAEAPAKILLSMHSFTPVYEGHVREVEIGVLFDDEEELAHRIAALLQPSGYAVRLNEPYTGKGGMMFSCYKHAHDHGLRGIELELRQDLLADPVHYARLLGIVHEAIATAAAELP
ncbi:MAG: N-formylglutamate amidohydrolase [Myxococcales bacterium]|nr:N-formylglutamate amidohydrolase [Myxococcales bacterium]MCB9670451.1 N-formylglutamate amidohydrolase [Alphaproteobacteria bacterium]MCB9694261.1 N-formylglutamate amidohydrolase [Alphaproteobacteria bacterium]